MKRTMIESIYFEFVDTDAYEQDEDRIKCENYQNELDEKIEGLLGNADRKLINEIEETVNHAECVTEIAGFAMGFKYAMRLMKECML